MTTNKISLLGGMTIKKKIIYIGCLAAISVAAFFIGRNTINTENSIDPANIVDWNTDGEELSLFTNDGYEFYAYKSEIIYENPLYIPVDRLEQ